MSRIKQLISLVALLVASGSLFADPTAFKANFDKMNQNVANYLGNNMPFINSLGMNDATGAKYGFPFFAVGISGSVGFLPNLTSELASGVNKSVVDTSKLPVSMDFLPIPYGPTIFGRVGIPGIDLDVGLKVGMPVDLTVQDFSLKNTAFGGELRYSILSQGLTPGISVAAGFDYMDGSLTYSDTGSYGSYSVDYKTQSSWSLVNYHVTARGGYDVLFLSLLGGLQFYVPTGDLTTKTTGTFNSGANSLNSKFDGDLGSLRVKGIAGLFFRLPLTRLGAMYEIEMNGGAMAFSFSAQLVF